MKICYVSLFLDIGRDKWTAFNRTFSEYFDSFRPFIELFSRNDPDYEMILYLDKRHTTDVKSAFSPNTKIRIVEIDEEWIHCNLPMWKTLSVEEKIMRSDRYRKLVSHRSHFPEHNFPRYTLLNHCKIDAVAHSTTISSADFFCWVDFGFFASPERIPNGFIDPCKLDSSTINYTLLSLPTDNDKDPFYTLQNAPEKFGGFFFYGRRDKMLEYQKLYHEVLYHYQTNLEIADDDQHLAMACAFKKPNLFTLYNIGKWHMALVTFDKKLIISNIQSKASVPPTQLCRIMNKHKSDKGNGWHNYTKIYHSLFSEIREQKLNILEIGIGSVNPQIISNMCGTASGDYTPGASARGWHEYFPNSHIYVCDIDKDIINFPQERITGFFLDQTDSRSIIEQLYGRFADIQFDIIIDDGLHRFSLNWEVLKLLFPKLKNGGIYIIEDVVDYDQRLVGKPNFNWQYIEIPNPENSVDNNIFVAKRNL